MKEKSLFTCFIEVGLQAGALLEIKELVQNGLAVSGQLLCKVARQLHGLLPSVSGPASFSRTAAHTEGPLVPNSPPVLNCMVGRVLLAVCSKLHLLPGHWWST